VREKARTAQQRELPESANCPKAQTAQKREVPNGDNGADIERREVPNCATSDGGYRRPGLELDTASRRYAVAPFGISRRRAVRAL